MMKETYEQHLIRRGQYTDTSDLDAAGQFKPYFRGPRIRVDGPAGIRTGTVGMTTGWRPAFLLMHRVTDSGSSDVLGPEDRIVAVQYGRRYVDLHQHGCCEGKHIGGGR